MHSITDTRPNRIVVLTERLILSSRWILAPIYLATLARVLYVCYLYFTARMDEEALTIDILGCLDKMMVGNLVIMTVIGSWSIFVKEINIGDYVKGLPRFLQRMTSGLLKIKMGTSVVGISLIHLLKTFFQLAENDNRTIFIQTILHLVFLASAFYVAKIDALSHSNEPAAH